MLPLRDRVNTGAMTMRGYSAFPKAPALLEPHYHISSVISRTLVWGGGYPFAEKQSVYSAAPPPHSREWNNLFWSKFLSAWVPLSFGLLINTTGEGDKIVVLKKKHYSFILKLLLKKSMQLIDYVVELTSTGWNDKIVVLKKTTLQLYFKTFIEKINSANLII